MHLCMGGFYLFDVCICTYEDADHSKSLPAGDTTSPTTLGSGTHTDTQHTVTGECTHYCCISEAVAMKQRNASVLLSFLTSSYLLGEGRSLWYETSSMECQT